MRVWERDGSGTRSAAPLIDARSATCAVEVGGGPWWDAWRAEVRAARVGAVPLSCTHAALCCEAV